MEQRLPYSYQSVIFSPFIYIHYFKLYGQCVKKMEEILHAAKLFMQNAKLLQRPREVARKHNS